MATLKQSFGKLPPVMQWVIIIGGVGAVFFGARAIVKGIQSSGRARKTIRDINAEEKEYLKAGEKLSYPPTQYKSFAAKLEQAMFMWGTDEDAIFAVFKKLNNNVDFLQLEKAFGIRGYSGGLVSEWAYGKYTLTQWLTEELDNADIKKINAILKNKGITYRY